jgi:hypothetical protein
MTKFLTVPALAALLIVANSAAFARGGASSFAPGQRFVQSGHQSQFGLPGASGYTPRQLFLHQRCSSTHGVSGCAPGHRFHHR